MNIFHTLLNLVNWKKLEYVDMKISYFLVYNPQSGSRTIHNSNGTPKFSQNVAIWSRWFPLWDGSAISSSKGL